MAAQNIDVVQVRWIEYLTCNFTYLCQRMFSAEIVYIYMYWCRSQSISHDSFESDNEGP